MKIILHGKLARLFGAEHFMKTQVPADAIEGLSRQLDWPKTMPVDVIGYDTEERLRAVTSDQEIHLVPSMEGGGGVGRVLLGVALIVVGAFTASPYLIIAGIGLVLSGVMELFLKAPTISKSEDPPASKYLGLDKNTTAIGTYRTLAYGRTQIAGHWLSLQVDAKSLVKGRFPETLPA